MVENGNFVTVNHETYKRYFVAVIYPYSPNIICAVDGYVDLLH